MQTEHQVTQGEAPVPAGARLDRHAFAELYAQWYPTLRTVAAAHVGPDAADDVVQQAAITAMARLDRFALGTDFRAWMAAIVRGAGRNHRRSERRHKNRHERAATTSHHADLHLDNDPGFAGPIDAEVSEAISTLPDRQRECFLLKVVSGHGYREISQIVEIPEATARSDVHRARRALVEVLGRRGHGKVSDG